MKRKIGIVIIWLIAIVFVFYAGLKTAHHLSEYAQRNQTGDAPTETETVKEFDAIEEIPVADVEAIAAKQPNGITKLQAEQLCRDVLGDTAEENGFPISYHCIGSVSANGRLYYVMDIAWYVDRQHWSYIGNCFVSSDGQEIYDGVAASAQYTITDLRWKNEF